MTDTSAAPIAYRMSTLNSSVSIGTMTIPPPSPVSAPTTPAPRAPSQTRSVSSRTLGAMPPCFSARCDAPDTAGVSTAMIVHRIAATEAVSTPSMFAPVSTPAFAIRDLSFLVLAIVTFIFVVVAGVTVYAILRYRRRPGDDDRDPPQVYGSTQIELAWTVVPFLIVIILFLTTTRYIFAIERPAATRDTVEVTVVGNQWWWEIRYPQLGIVTANELHVPVSDAARPTRTFLKLQSADVAHSFWVPQLAGKTDVIPGRENSMWFEPTQPGTYLGNCAEYCGMQHARMLICVVVQPPAEFERWVAEQKRSAAEAPSA